MKVSTRGTVRRFRRRSSKERISVKTLSLHQNHTYRASNMDSIRVRDRVQMPAPFAHAVANLMRFHLRVLGAERDDRGRRVAEDIQIRNLLLNPRSDGLGSANDRAARFEVTAGECW